jgi:hypothetical protein
LAGSRPRSTSEQPDEKILAIFDAFSDWFASDSYQGCLFVNTLLERHDQSGPVREAATEKLLAIRALLKPIAETGG